MKILPGDVVFFHGKRCYVMLVIPPQHEPAHFEKELEAALERYLHPLSPKAVASPQRVLSLNSFSMDSEETYILATVPDRLRWTTSIYRVKEQDLLTVPLDKVVVE